MSVTLTNDQRNALAKFTAFMLGNKPYMVLSGSAGVGKTFILKHMLEAVKNPNGILALMGGEPIKKVAITATTNKAAEVMQQAMRGVKGIEDVGTIHSFLKLNLKNDFETGQTRLVKSRDFELVRNTLIVIDECSMVDRALLKIIKESTVNCKVMFMGDRCQMASVFEDESEVFSMSDDQVEMAEMEEVVRNRGVPALGAVCRQLREVVKSGRFTPVIPDGQDIVLLSAEEMQFRLNNDFVLQDGLDKRILAFSNNRVQTYNAYIRESRGLPPQYQEHETLICNNVVVSGKNRNTRIEQVVEVRETGEQYMCPQLKALGWDIPVYKLETSAGTLIQPVDFSQVTWALKQLANARQWGTYFNLKQTYADLRMPQAATVYKAQGSTYDTVYIDLGDIGLCNNPAQAARMLYVAYSRAAKKVYLYGELPPRYQGNAA